MDYKLKKIYLKNYRNIDQKLFEFTPFINCIFGENGNGKTNILEAVYFLSNKKSFRKNTDFSKIISINGENLEFIISVLLEKEKQDFSFSLKQTSKKSFWSLNGKNIRSKPKLFQTIFVSPFESNFFHINSSFRRNWFNTHLSLFSEDYKKNLKKYNKLLKFKNNLLSKKERSFRKQIKILDKELSLLNFELTQFKLKFIEDLNLTLTETFKTIFSEDSFLNLSLKSKIKGKSKEEIFNILQENREKDEILGHSKEGIHRDDYVLYYNRLNAYEYCSLGQQKMSFISILFAYIELFRYKFTYFPMLLIDDISSEFDKVRWEKLINYLERKEFQILITTANENFKNELSKISKVSIINICSDSLNKI